MNLATIHMINQHYIYKKDLQIYLKYKLIDYFPFTQLNCRKPSTSMKP